MTYMHSSSSPFELHAPPISSFLTHSNCSLEKRTSYEAPICTIVEYKRLRLIGYNVTMKNENHVLAMDISERSFACKDEVERIG
jgi:hypothetical protein